ncbi:putative transcription factor Hap3/NF-YB family [Helianthus annuus]|nr:putative transcription factor Hap3/NF-YB family [Helianthus annuus]
MFVFGSFDCFFGFVFGSFRLVQPCFLVGPCRFSMFCVFAPCCTPDGFVVPHALASPGRFSTNLWCLVIKQKSHTKIDKTRPLPETVALVEDIVVEYVTDMVHKAQDIASKRGKLLTEDFLFLIRKDLPKLNRCTELLSMNEELKQARKAFDVDEEKLVSPE